MPATSKGPASQERSCDVLIEGAAVIDGTGKKAFLGDVAVDGERIIAVGNLAGMRARRCIDAAGLVLAPGFIDAHTHDDRAVLSSPEMAPKVSQGVTTVVAGNCGVSLAPLADCDPPPPLNLLGGREWYRFPSAAEYAARVDAEPPALNVAMLVGHSTLRVGAMSDLARAAAPSEIDHMVERLDEALAAGCIGMSTGLAYPPAQAAPTDEIVVLAERVAANGGIYTTHMRNERDLVVDSVKETLEIGERANVPVVISHHKCSGRENWGLTKKTLELIRAARARQRVDLDVYPYVASSTVLIASWVEAAERVLVTWSEPHPELAGRDFEAIRAGWGCSVEEAVARLLPAGGIYYQMDEEDVRRVLAFEDAMVGSDGLPHDAFPHPRLWGTFPRVLGHYSRDVGLFPLEEAVRRMTSVPAAVFGLPGRGSIRENAYADLVLFDPEQIIDKADFQSPMQPAEGIREVFVNGKSVWCEAATTGERPGRLLRRSRGAA